MAEPSRGARPYELEQLKELMERTGETDERMEKVLTVSALDHDTYANLHDFYLQGVAQVVTKDVFYPYERLEGEFPIGHDPDGQRIGLTREQLNEHSMVVGRSGSGKTTFFYNLLEACSARDVPFMIFDFKNDYRHLVDRHDLLVVNWRDFKFNPLAPPPGVRVEKWGEILADTFSHGADLLIGSEGYVLEKLKAVYDHYAAVETDQYPSVFELRDLVMNDKLPRYSPRYGYKERLVNRLTIFTGFSGSIFDCSEGQPLNELLNRNVVFELQEPNKHVASFVVEAVLTWIYYYRDAMGQRQQFRHLILFDEAKRVFDVNRERNSAAGFPPIDYLVGQFREFGEGLVVADQEPSKLTDSIKANTYAKIWMPLGSGKDIREMAYTFGLEGEEIDFTRTMPKGEALLKLADSKPVPIHLPDYRVKKWMTEDDIRTRMAPEIDELSVEEREPPERVLTLLSGDDSTESTDSTDGLKTVAEALLVSINDQPFLGLADRYKAIAVDTKKGTRAKEELVKLGLVREVEINTRTRGRNPKLLELTSDGRRRLIEHGNEIRPGAKGGLEHQWWQEKIKQYYEADGYDVTVEYHLGKKSIDVYAVRADDTIAVEIARSPEHEVENIKKCLAHGPDQIQVVYLEEEVRDAIQAQLRTELGDTPDRVSFSPVTAFT